MKITEQNFITQIIQGNEKALEYCMYHYGGLVRAVVRRHLGSLSKFEDECINDVFFAVWEHADSYRSVYCIIKFPKVAEAIPQSCRGNFPNNAAVFGASLSLLGW